MTVALVVVAVIAVASLALNAAYVVHELGWFPHTKDRSRPRSRAFPHRSMFARDVPATHGYLVVDPLTSLLREHGHADVYEIADPLETLQTIARRYREDSSYSRRDDLVHVTNHVCSRTNTDDKIDAAVEDIVELLNSRSYEQEPAA